MRLAEQVQVSIHVLPPVLDLAGAELLHRTLLGACAPENEITLDASAVERVSTACVQVLLAAARSARARGQGFALKQASPSLMAALDDLGVSGLLVAGDAA